MRGLRKALTEPLVQFLLAGAVLLGLWRMVTPTPLSRQLEITALQLERLRADHQRRTGKPPTATEEASLLARYVDQEILYREALARGLDRGDVIVRRRLAQKMQFVAQEEVSESELDDAALTAWLRAHLDRYSDGARVSFEQVFVAKGHDVGLVEARLRDGADAARLGDPFVGGRVFVARSERQLSAQLGAGFAVAVAALPVGIWTRVESTFGSHLVKVSAIDRHAPELAEVRARVRVDLLADLQSRRAESALAGLRARYVVSVVR